MTYKFLEYYDLFTNKLNQFYDLFTNNKQPTV